MSFFILLLTACSTSTNLGPVSPGTSATVGPNSASAHPPPGPTSATLAPSTPLTAPENIQATGTTTSETPIAPVTDNARMQGPLSVVIISPEDGAEVREEIVELKGEADPETVINIDDQIVVVGVERKFSILVHLKRGENVIEITASDLEGNQGTTYLTLTYSP